MPVYITAQHAQQSKRFIGSTIIINLSKLIINKGYSLQERLNVLLTGVVRY